MVHNLVHNLCESLVTNIGGVAGIGKKTPPTPITYLTQWKIVGNSQVHTDPYLTSWKVSGNSVVDNNTILSCGDLGQDGKYHVKISNGVTIFDIPLTEPLRKVNDVADKIEFKDGVATVTRYLKADLLTSGTWAVSLHSQLTNSPRWRNVIKPIDNGSVVANILIEGFITYSYNTLSASKPNYGCALSDGNNIICISDPSFIPESGTTTTQAFRDYIEGKHIIYELLTPTTETIQVPDIAVSPTDTYTSANVTPYSAFEHTENKEIWSCGEYNATDGKYHILVKPQGGSIADIALDEPLRKINSVADTIEFPSGTEGKALVTRNVESKTVSAYNDADGNQIATTLQDNTILHIQNLYDYTRITRQNVFTNNTSQRSAEVKITNLTGANFCGFNMPLRSGKYYSSCLFKNEYAKPNVIYTDSGNSSVINSSDYQKASVLKRNITMFRYSALNNPTGIWEIDNVFFVKDINIFNIDAMFADCTDLKPANTSDFEDLFPNLGCIDRTNTAIDVIVKDGKLYKEDVIGIEILVPLATPTMELVDAPQIQEAESYTCEISQGGKAVEWTEFVANPT